MTIEITNPFNCFNFNRRKDNIEQDRDIELTDLAKETAQPNQEEKSWFDALWAAVEEKTQQNAEATESSNWKIKEESKRVAKAIDEHKRAYLLFGALDGGNLVYSLLKCALGMKNLKLKAGNSSMHDWLLTPTGLASASVLFLTMPAYSAMGSFWDEKDDNAMKAFIAKTWPYIRDMIKAAKNGFNSTINVYSTFSFHSLPTARPDTLRPDFIFPTALILGSLSVINRLLYRYMLSLRKDMMKNNSNLLDRIRAERFLTKEQAKAFRHDIAGQTLQVQTAALISSFYGGVVDSFYLYFGVFNLCAFAPPVFAAILSCCIVYSIINVGCRLWEEHDYQHQLVITGKQIEFELFQKKHEEKLDMLLTKIQRLSIDLLKVPASANASIHKELKALIQEKNALIQKFTNAHQRYKEAVTVSRCASLFGGFKNGLSAQNTVFGIMFTVVTFASIFAGTACPPVFFLVCTALGFAFLASFACESWCRNTAQREQLDKDHLAYCQQLSQKATTFLESNIEQSHDTLLRPQVHDFSEIIRTLFSGVAKGFRLIQFLFNYLMVKDGNNYKESLAMLIMMPIAGALNGLIFSFRAFARWGRDPIFKPKKVAQDEGLMSEPVSRGEFGPIEPRPDSQRNTFGSTPPLMPTYIPRNRPTLAPNLPKDAFCYSPGFFQNKQLSPKEPPVAQTLHEEVHSLEAPHCDPRYSPPLNPRS